MEKVTCIHWYVTILHFNHGACDFTKLSVGFCSFFWIVYVDTIPTSP